MDSMRVIENYHEAPVQISCLNPFANRHKKILPVEYLPLPVVIQALQNSLSLKFQIFSCLFPRNQL